MAPTESPHPGTFRVPLHEILLVEDEADTADSIQQCLQQRGYRVRIAKDGGQAQALFVMRKPDFVILDIILPGESGFEICDRLKHNDENVPIMFLSVIDLPESTALAKRVRADGYLTKPFDPNELVRCIEQIAQEVWDRVHAETSRRDERIRFSCLCGKRFKVSAIHRGKTLTCPECGEPVVVPKHE